MLWFLKKDGQCERERLSLRKGFVSGGRVKATSLSSVPPRLSASSSRQPPRLASPTATAQGIVGNRGRAALPSRRARVAGDSMGPGDPAVLSPPLQRRRCGRRGPTGGSACASTPAALSSTPTLCTRCSARPWTTTGTSTPWASSARARGSASPTPSTTCRPARPPRAS